MIDYSPLWQTMEEKGITQYAQPQEKRTIDKRAPYVGE